MWPMVSHQKEMETVVYDLLMSNNYPKCLIKRLVLRYLENIREQDPDGAVVLSPSSSHVTSKQSTARLLITDPCHT